MSRRHTSYFVRVLPLAALGALLCGCAGTSPVTGFVAEDEKECMARVMYFESNRSSEDGMLAVGTVVMNRIESGKYTNTVCGVVGQKNQFAPGALTRPLDEGRSAALARRVAEGVLQGARHPKLAKKVMFFHTAGYHFPFSNMRYVLAAGGNVFYYKDNGPRLRFAAAVPNDPKLNAYASKIAPEATVAYAEQPAESPIQIAMQTPVVQPAAAPEQVAAACQPAETPPVAAVEPQQVTAAAPPADTSPTEANPAPPDGATR